MSLNHGKKNHTREITAATSSDLFIRQLLHQQNDAVQSTVKPLSIMDMCTKELKLIIFNYTLDSPTLLLKERQQEQTHTNKSHTSLRQTL